MSMERPGAGRAPARLPAKAAPGVVALILPLLTAIACNFPGLRAGPEATPTGSPSAAEPGQGTPVVVETEEAAWSPPEHRIQVRVVDGRGEFYDRLTGEKFVPRGFNYVKLREVNDPVHGPGFYDLVLSTLNFDAAETRRELRQMRGEGYNLVRIMLETCAGSGCIGVPGGKLDPDYLDNLVAFLEIARQEELYVWITSNTLPNVGYYIEKGYAEEGLTFAASNAHTLTRSGVEAYREYFQDLIGELIQRRAPLDIIFGYALRNEHFYEGDRPPFTLESGLVTAANGLMYNMERADDKERMMEEGLIFWFNEVRAAILEVDPTALVGVGFFAPNRPHAWRPPEDLRLVRTDSLLRESDADFVDLHIYPLPDGLNLQQFTENYGSQGVEEVPLILGEFGVFRRPYPSLATGAQALIDLQVESCALGYDGWLLWHWEGDWEVWGALEDEEILATYLAPSLRPDPCVGIEVPNPNLALGKPVRVSKLYAGNPPSNAVDGTEAAWTSGDFPPQWIEVDLGAPARIERMRLTIDQFPDGVSTHQVWVRGPEDQLRLVHEFEQDLTFGDVLEYVPDTPLSGVQHLRVLTVESPSWVSWIEIEVFGDFEG